MTCRELMTSDPPFCVPEDNVVCAAMLMKQHDVGSIPVVADRISMKLTGIVTDRDLVLRVVAEQRDYYSTRVAEVVSEDLVTCRESDDSDKVLAAMEKRQVGRIPVVDSNERLLGIISQAPVAPSTQSRDVASAVGAISEPESMADGGSGFTKAGLMVAGGLGLGAGLLYLIRQRQTH